MTLQFQVEIGTIRPAGMLDTLNKTLIIRFSSVGDIVLSSPLVRALRRRFPDVQMDFLVRDTYADLMRYNPHLHRIITFPADGTLRDLLALRRRVRAEGYDAVLDIHGSLRSLIVSVGVRGVRRINKRKLARFLLVHAHRDFYPWLGGSPGIAQRYLETAASWKVEDDGKGPELHIPMEVRASAQETVRRLGLPAGHPVLGLAPSARHATKIWPAERFAEAAAAVAGDRHSNVLLFGSSEERARCDQIADTIRRSNPGTTVVNLAGQLSLLETAAAMDGCAAVITNDTGLMHLAVARKRPVVALFGCTTRQLGFFPSGDRVRVVEHPSLACRPCTPIGRPRCPQHHFRCMLDLAVPTVLRAVDDVWDGGTPPITNR